MYPFPVYPPAQQYTPQMQFNPRGVSQEQFSVIPVSSEEEAKNAIVNPLSTYLFVDCSSGKIFYKKMNSSGKSAPYGRWNSTGSIKSLPTEKEVENGLLL